MDSFTCPKCGMTSYHPDDIKNRYCGNCHEFIPKEALRGQVNPSLCAHTKAS
jgi:RNase P subunit RPR2